MISQCKGILSSWEPLKDVKERFPVQLAKYEHQLIIYEETELAWWVPQMMNKRNSIVSYRIKYILWNKSSI